MKFKTAHDAIAHYTLLRLQETTGVGSHIKPVRCIVEGEVTDTPPADHRHPLHLRVLGHRHMAFLIRTCDRNPDGTLTSPSSETNGFKWPDSPGSVVEVPDWNPERMCGGGLHGFKPPTIKVHSTNSPAQTKMLAGIEAICRLSTRIPS